MKQFLSLRFREEGAQKGFSSRIIKWESSQWDLFPGTIDDCVIYTEDGIMVLELKFNFVTCGLL